MVEQVVGACEEGLEALGDLDAADGRAVQLRDELRHPLALGVAAAEAELDGGAHELVLHVRRQRDLRQPAAHLVDVVRREILVEDRAERLAERLPLGDGRPAERRPPGEAAVDGGEHLGEGGLSSPPP